MISTIICDLDGTLCNDHHRRIHGVPQWEATQYDQYYSTMSKDEPYGWCVELLVMYWRSGYNILFVTGRPERFRGETELWLEKHLPFGVKQLYMRPDGDYRCDTIIKEEIYRRHIEPNHRIELVLDDRDRVVKMWRSFGLTCLQPQEGNF